MQFMSEGQKKNNSFLLQGMILAVAGIITRLIGIAYRIPLTNILGEEGQGYYGSAFSIYNIALLLTSYSLPLAVSKLVSARVAKKEQKNAFRIFKGALLFALVVGFCVFLVIFVFAEQIAENVMSLRLSAYALRVLAPGLLIVAVMGVVRGFFQGLGTMVPTAISQILEQIVNAVISIIGASYLLKMGQEVAGSGEGSSISYAYGAAGGTLGTVCGALFGLLFLAFLFYLYYPRFRRKMRHDRTIQTESYSEIYRVLLLTIAPVILSTAIYNISETIDISVFSNVMNAQGLTEQEVAAYLGRFTGHYNVLINIPLAVANSLGASLIPSLTAAVSSGTKRQVHEKIGMVIRFSMLIAIPSCAGFLALAKPILSLLFSGDMTISAQMLQLGAITVVFYCMSTVTNAILQGINRMTTPVRHGAISLVLHLVALYIMLAGFKWGIYALVAGNIVFSLSMCILNAVSLRRYIGYRQEIRRTFLLPIIAAALMSVVALLVYTAAVLVLPQAVSTLLALMLAVVVYAVMLLRLGALLPEEILAIPKGDKILSLCQKLHFIA